MVLTVAALLETGELTSDEEVKRGLAGNLCRCTGYRGDRRGGLRAGRGGARERGRRVAPAPRRGRPLRRPAGTPARSCAARPSSRATSSCRACSTARCCASPIAHARIVSIDASDAEAMPGVVCVLTAADLGDIDPYWGHAIQRPARRGHRPRALRRRARRGGRRRGRGDGRWRPCERILVEYEELAVVGTIEQALADGRAAASTSGPLRPGLFHGLGELTPARGQRLLPLPHRPRRGRGRLRATPSIVVEGEYTFPAVYQYAMETHTVVAQVEGDEITLWASCQHPFLVRAEIAALFQVPIAERAHRRPLPRRRLRLEVVHEDGADHGRARAQGRPPGADPEPRRRVDGDDAPPRDARAACGRR